MLYSESYVNASDGLSLFSCQWKPVSDAKAVVCLVHGLGEHSGRYAHVAEALTSAGYAVVASDIRGHGKSGGPKGHTPSYELLMEDIRLLLSRAEAYYSELPCFLYGHSMGGNLVLNYAMRRRPALAGVVSTSPWLRLSMEPELFKVVLGRLMNILWPTFAQKNGLSADDLYHSPAGESTYAEDPLNHSFISARLFVSIRQSGLWALENAADFPLPLLLMHGSDDRITSCEASRRFSSALPDRCTFKLWEGCYHELHNEPQRQEILAFIVDWMNLQTNTQANSGRI